MPVRSVALTLADPDPTNENTVDAPKKTVPNESTVAVSVPELEKPL
ncbi:MAG: hypothetical protein KJ000_29260 [Pirellulaceae bacterium]|nr:hypothetical protein [Pirellulaceae bacterium]